METSRSHRTIPCVTGYKSFLERIAEQSKRSPSIRVREQENPFKPTSRLSASFETSHLQSPKVMSDLAPTPTWSPPPSSFPESTIANNDPYDFLKSFDTVFLIDDSGSMAGRAWKNTAAAIGNITPVCTSSTSEGVEIVSCKSPNGFQEPCPSIETIKLGDIPSRYPPLSRYLSSDETFTIYRHFDPIFSRLLLHKQDELARLENEFRSLDEHAAKFERRRKSASDRGNGLPNAKSSDRKELLDMLENKLRQYSRLLAQARLDTEIQLRTLELVDKNPRSEGTKKYETGPFENSLKQLASPLNLLMPCLPLAWISQALGWNPVAIFVLNFLAIIPLAAMLNSATEEIVYKISPYLSRVANSIWEAIKTLRIILPLLCVLVSTRDERLEWTFTAVFVSVLLSKTLFAARSKSTVKDLGEVCIGGIERQFKTQQSRELSWSSFGPRLRKTSMKKRTQPLSCNLKQLFHVLPWAYFIPLVRADAVDTSKSSSGGTSINLDTSSPVSDWGHLFGKHPLGFEGSIVVLFGVVFVLTVHCLIATRILAKIRSLRWITGVTAYWTSAVLVRKDSSAATVFT